MKYLGKITDNKDLVTKEYVDEAASDAIEYTDTAMSSLKDGAYRGVTTSVTSTSASLPTASAVYSHVSSNMPAPLPYNAEVGDSGLVTAGSVALTTPAGAQPCTFVAGVPYYVPGGGGSTYYAGTGLSASGTTFNHATTITAGTTQNLYSITFNSTGHITAATAVGLSAYLSRTTISKVYSTAIASGSTATIAVSGSKAGYYPIGVVGYSTTRTLANIYRAQITSATSGNVTVTVNVHNMHTAQWANISVYCDVLWAKM